MANVCIIRHKGYIKSKMRFPYQHNFRTLKNYGNKNIEASLTHLNTIITNNLKKGENYLSAFNRIRDNGEFKGQLKVQGAEDKQTKFLDEFLVYPPYEKITEMSSEKQEAFFQEVLKALRKKFPHMIILSAHVHRDEIFHPRDEEMKALFPEGKVTPHMHVIAIPIIHDKKMDCKKISITELWGGKFSYRKFQDFMYDEVGKEYGFDRGVLHDYGEANKHLTVEEFKLQQRIEDLTKHEKQVQQKEQEITERAKNLEPVEKITRHNINRVVESQREINYAWNLERENNAKLQKEKDSLIQSIKQKDELILAQSHEIQNHQEKLSEVEKELLLEKEKTNDILNIQVSDERLRQVYIDEAKQKIKLFDRVVRIIKDFLPDLIKVSPKFIRELLDFKILHEEDMPGKRVNNHYKDR